MHEIRQFIGYAIGVAGLTIAVGFGINALSLEAGRYALSDSDKGHLSASTNGSARPSIEVRDPGAQPVWIAPTPKYEYDPKLMELKPPHLLRKEAELRRQQDHAKYRAAQREASVRHKQNIKEAREAFAFAGTQERPAFLMFSPH